MQELVESKIAERIVEMTEKMVTEEQQMMSEQGEDPLIQLKQQEKEIELIKESLNNVKVSKKLN